MKIPTIPRVENVTSEQGNAVANQFIIRIYGKAVTTTIFQSYDSIIAVRVREIGIGSTTYIDKNKWDYSKTTGKYRNLFLREDKRATERKIKSGEYKLADLNGGN